MRSCRVTMFRLFVSLKASFTRHKLNWTELEFWTRAKHIVQTVVCEHWKQSQSKRGRCDMTRDSTHDLLQRFWLLGVGQIVQSTSCESPASASRPTSDLHVVRIGWVYRHCSELGRLVLSTCTRITQLFYWSSPVQELQLVRWTFPLERM